MTKSNKSTFITLMKQMPGRVIRLFTILSIGKRHSIHGGTCVHMCRPREFITDQRANGEKRNRFAKKFVFGTNWTARVLLPGLTSPSQKIGIDSRKVRYTHTHTHTHWWVVTLKKRCENCGAESSGPCGAGKLATNITGFRAKLCLLCLRKATLSLAIRSG